MTPATLFAAKVLLAQRRPSTRLEYAVMLALNRASGRMVTRDEMLAEIWNTPLWARIRSTP